MIYHYTSVETLYHLINGIRIEPGDPDGVNRSWSYFVMRASHIAFLNDLKEGQLLPEALRQLKVKEYSLIHANMLSGYPFVLSFSRKEDDLTMWRGYATNGYGVSLGFEENVLFDILEKHGEKVDQHFDCEYKSVSEIMEIIKSNSHYQEYCTKKKGILPLIRLINDALRYKDVAFKEEEEYRIVLDEWNGEQYSFRNNLIIPYYEQKMPLDALKCITFGPNADYDKLLFSTKRLLKSKINKKNDIKYQKSKVPYIS